tara:strand:- start:6387 stop:7235 length:849 start_codon:yes stop_codon:yes gene_type:complete
MVLLVLSTSFYTRYTFDFKIQQSKNILVLGNSHPECAINDSLLANVFNLAQSGTGYFYDYIKAKKIISENPGIDTIIVGYTYGDLEKPMDSWFDGGDKLKFKIRNYLFLFEWGDYFELLQANPIDVILNTPQTIFYNLKMKQEGYNYLGGFKALENSKLKQAQELKAMHKPDTSLGYSRYQTKYLSKLYEYCNKKDIKLILLNTPIHPVLDTIQSPLKAMYYNFANNNLPNALLINHANFKLPNNNYRDLDHLNVKGANNYSKFLKTNKFKSSVPEEENPME